MFSLDHFYKLPSIVQILVAEFLMALCLGGIVTYAYRAIWPRQLSYTPLPLGWGDFAFAACGMALLLWLMWGPLYPRIAGVSWTPVFHSGKLDAIGVMPGATVDYGFPTNHPSYVFIDLIVISVWAFFRMVMSEGNAERLYEANLWLSVAAIVPLWRLICWYGLGRRRPAAMRCGMPGSRSPSFISTSWLRWRCFSALPLSAAEPFKPVLKGLSAIKRT